MELRWVMSGLAEVSIAIDECIEGGVEEGIFLAVRGVDLGEVISWVVYRGIANDGCIEGEREGCFLAPGGC